MKKSLFKSKMTAVAIAGVAIVLVALGLILPGSNNLDNGDMKNASAKKKIEKFEDKSRAKDVKKKNKPKVLKEKLEFSKDKSFAYTDKISVRSEPYAELGSFKKDIKKAGYKLASKPFEINDKYFAKVSIKKGKSVGECEAELNKLSNVSGCERDRVFKLSDDVDTAGSKTVKEKPDWSWEDLLPPWLKPKKPKDKESKGYQIDKMNVESAWNYVKDHKKGKTKIGAVDTGVQGNHEDLQESLNKNESTCTEDAHKDNGYNDLGSHGSHVMGIMVATTGNKKGIKGIATTYNNNVVSALMVQAAFNSEEVKDGKKVIKQYFKDEAMAKGIKYAADRGCRIVGLSISGLGGSSAVSEAVKYALGKGTLVVYAAGNDSKDIGESGYRENKNILAVISTDSNDNKSGFSNYGGAHNKISAPGSDIYSTVPNNSYSHKSGTSMACPAVNSVGAMVAAINPSLEPQGIKRLLQNTVDDLGASGYDDTFGYGRVNAWRAVTQAADKKSVSFWYDYPGLDGREECVKGAVVSNGDSVGSQFPSDIDIKRPHYKLKGWSTVKGSNTVNFTKDTKVYSNMNVYAVWARDKHKVELDADYDGGEKIIAEIEWETDLLLPTPKAREGHKFMGWSTVSNDAGHIVPARYTVTKDIKLYAVWKRNTHYVSFDSAGGSNHPSSKGIAYGDMIQSLPSPGTKEGHKFMGWSTVANDTGYIVSVGYTVTRDIKLYAVWKRNTYYVSFDSAGGSNHPNSMGIAYGDMINSLPSPGSKEGHKFLGWSTVANDYREIITPAYIVKKDIILYAVWETNTYNVTLDARGGIFKSDSSHTVRFSRKYGEAIGRLPAADKLHREAYEFAGWSREANDQGQDVNEHAAVKGDLVIYAKWKDIYLDVKYYKNEANSSPAKVKSLKYGSRLSELLPESETAKEGYDLVGYKIVDDSGHSFTYPVSKIEDVKDYVVKKSISIYPMFKLQTFNLKFNVNGGEYSVNGDVKPLDDVTYNYGDTVKLTDLPDENSLKKPNHVFLYWEYKTDSMQDYEKLPDNYVIKSDTSLRAMWDRIPAKVRFNLNGGNYMVDGKAEPLDDREYKNGDILRLSDLPNEDSLKKQGHEFICWTYKSDDMDSYEVLPDNYVIGSSISLLAAWKKVEVPKPKPEEPSKPVDPPKPPEPEKPPIPKKYKVSFAIGDAEGEASVLIVNDGDTLGDKLPTNIHKEGMHFIGWSTKKGATYQNFYKFTKVNKNITLYPVFKTGFRKEIGKPGLTAVKANGYPKLTLKHPVANIHSAFKVYRKENNSSSKEVLVAVIQRNDELSIFDFEAQPGKEYVYRAVATMIDDGLEYYGESAISYVKAHKSIDLSVKLNNTGKTQLVFTPVDGAYRYKIKIRNVDMYTKGAKEEQLIDASELEKDSSGNYVYTMKDNTSGKYSVYTVEAMDGNAVLSTSNEASIFKLDAVEKLKLKVKRFKKNRQVLLTFNRAKNADGYMIYKRTGKKGQFVLIKKLASKKAVIKYLDKKCKANKRYYYKVVAYKKLYGIIYRGVYSKIIGIKIK